MKKIQAINNHVVVEEVIKKEDKTDSGIIIPQTVKMEPQKYGKVLSVGENVKNVKENDMDFKERFSYIYFKDNEFLFDFSMKTNKEFVLSFLSCDYDEI